MAPSLEFITSYFSLDVLVALLPIAPFLAAFIAPLIFRYAGHHAGWILAIVPAGIFAFLFSFIDQIANGGLIYTELEWVPSYEVSFSFLIDGLSLTFALLISGIGTIIVIYSGNYLKGHHHQGRFFAYLLMFMGSMLGLVLADNLIVLFIFWELTSITSFLLIGFNHTQQASRRAAIQALVVTNAGGLALLVGIILLHQVTGTWSLSVLFAMVAEYGPFLHDSPFYVLIFGLFCLGAFTKSAQFPFHFWLPNAMEAPTPVSAFLHSATMVKAGIYLLARMSPILANGAVVVNLPVLGETSIYLWNVVLTSVGGFTLLYGATMALRQTDLKQMLAQTTVASLGLLVLLLGVGTEAAVSAAVLYLIAHALYKAGLFLVSGIIDHGTGTREVTELGGLARLMPVTFIAAALAALSMAGIPLTVGFLAKEEMYSALANPEWWSIAVMVVMIVGNAMMAAVGLTVAIKPFLGGLRPTPLKPHEGAFALFVGPVLFGCLALAAGIMTNYLGHNFLTPAASSIYNHQVDSHLKLEFSMFLEPLFIASVFTWVLAGLLFWKIDEVRKILRRVETAIGWNFDIGFDWMMFGLIRMADKITRFWHHGRLEFYLVVIFIGMAAAIYIPLVLSDSLPILPRMPQLAFYEWCIFAIALLGLVALLIAQTRLVAIVSLGIQGFAVALIFMLFGAPDLSFTQFMVETLSVVILALVMTRLHLEQRDSRILEEVIRDSALALICGVGIVILLLVVLQTPIDLRLTEFFAATSTPIAHGHNIVNVILVDYRGLDTLGEIAVVMTAGIAILALVRIRAGGPRGGVGAAKPKRRAPRKATRRRKAVKT